MTKIIVVNYNDYKSVAFNDKDYKSCIYLTIFNVIWQHSVVTLLKTI